MFNKKNLSLAKTPAQKQSELIWDRLTATLNPSYHKIQLLTNKHPLALLIWVHLSQDERNPQRFYLCNDYEENLSNLWGDQFELGGMSNNTVLNTPSSILKNSPAMSQEDYDAQGRKRIKLCIFRLQWKESSITRGFDKTHHQVVRIIKEGWHVTHFSRNKLQNQELVLKIAETQAEQGLTEALDGFPLSETLLMPLPEFASLCNKFFDDLVEDMTKKEKTPNSVNLTRKNLAQKKS